jgi:hypothetical protein
MYIYTAYNLCIHSEISLPELVASQGSPDVIIRMGKMTEIPQEIIVQSNCYFGGLEEVCRFFFRNGEEVIIEPEIGIDECMLSPTILGSAMSVVLQQRGLLVLHASSVVINNRAVAFMGGAGWGKSTLAEAFHIKGYPVLTDDVLAVRTDMNYPIALPAFPQFKLLPEAAVALGHDTDSLSPLFPNAIKLSYRFSHGFHQESVPLERIYLLAKGNQHGITRLKQQEAFVELVRHTRGVSLLQVSDFRASHMHQCANLVKQVDFRRFTRKPSLSDLQKLVELVEQDCI